MSQHTVRKKPRLNHKFRFQLLAEWIFQNYAPCKVADIGGGKGLLSYLLIRKGFESVVIDPFHQILPYKFKDISTGQRIKLNEDEMQSIPRISAPFEIEMAKDFDLLVGLHAHGSNMKIIDAAKKYDKKFIILPCCVIDEPIVKQPGINWINSLIEYSNSVGHNTNTATLNFAGQNKLIFNA